MKDVDDVLADKVTDERVAISKAKHYLDEAYRAMIQAGLGQLALKLRPIRNKIQ